MCEANLTTVTNTCAPSLLCFVYKIKYLFIINITSGTDATDVWNVSILKIINILERFLNLVHELFQSNHVSFLLSSKFLKC